MDTNTQYQENLKSLGFSFDEKNKIAPYFVFYDAWDTGDTKKSIKISLYPELNNGFFTMTCPSKRIMQALFFYNKETIMYVIETIANVKIPVE